MCGLEVGCAVWRWVTSLWVLQGLLLPKKRKHAVGCTVNSASLPWVRNPTHHPISSLEPTNGSLRIWVLSAVGSYPYGRCGKHLLHWEWEMWAIKGPWAAVAVCAGPW